MGILTFLEKMQNMQLSYAKFFAARYLDHLFRRFLLNPTVTYVFAMHAHLGWFGFLVGKERLQSSLKDTPTEAKVLRALSLFLDYGVVEDYEVSDVEDIARCISF